MKLKSSQLTAASAWISWLNHVCSPAATDSAYNAWDLIWITKSGVQYVEPMFLSTSRHNITTTTLTENIKIYWNSTSVYSMSRKFKIIYSIQSKMCSRWYLKSDRIIWGMKIQIMCMSTSRNLWKMSGQYSSGPKTQVLDPIYLSLSISSISKSQVKKEQFQLILPKSQKITFKSQKPTTKSKQKCKGTNSVQPKKTQTQLFA